MAELMSQHERHHHRIKEHILGRLDKGHDILTIKDDLINRGFAHEDVHRAVDLAYGEIHKTEHMKEEIEHFLHPTKAKLVLPLIIIAMLVLHFSINIYHLPAVGDNLCSSVKISEEIDQVGKQSQVGSSLQSKLLLLEKRSSGIQKSLIDKYKTVITINFPLTFSKVYALDPFFSLPCETLSFYPSNNCRYYMSETDFECINSTKVVDSNIKVLFKKGVPEYKAISGWSVFINTAIIFLEVYLISCFIVFLYVSMKNKLSRTMREAVEIGGVILLVLLVIFAVLTYIYLIRMLAL
jgi:hypothetical protein